MSAEAASTAYFKDLVRTSLCFWRWPFGHYWYPLGDGSKECDRCHTWRRW